jgi:hypothetical protein
MPWEKISFFKHFLYLTLPFVSPEFWRLSGDSGEHANYQTWITNRKGIADRGEGNGLLRCGSHWFRPQNPAVWGA